MLIVISINKYGVTIFTIYNIYLAWVSTGSNTESTHSLVCMSTHLLSVLNKEYQIFFFLYSKFIKHIHLSSLDFFTWTSSFYLTFYKFKVLRKTYKFVTGQNNYNTKLLLSALIILNRSLTNKKKTIVYFMIITMIYSWYNFEISIDIRKIYIYII